MRITSCYSADGASLATVDSCLGNGGVAYCRSGLGDALRAVFIPRSDRVARVGRRRGGVFVFDLVVGIVSVARTGLRVRIRFVRGCRVLRIGHGSRIWICGDMAVGVEPENYEKLSEKLSLAPLCPHSKRGRPVRTFSRCVERVSCMRLSSMVRDAAKVSVVTVDAVQRFDVLFRGVLMVYCGGVAKSLFFAVVSA